MIRMLIDIALNRDLQGDPAYIRCARCGATADATTRTLHVTTRRPGLLSGHITMPPELAAPPLLRTARSRRAAPQPHPYHPLPPHLPVPLHLEAPPGPRHRHLPPLLHQPARRARQRLAPCSRLRPLAPACWKATAMTEGNSSSRRWNVPCRTG